MTEDLLGLHRAASDLTFLNMALRTVIVFAAGIVFLRLGARRELGRYAGFDIVMMVILGSVLSRGIIGQSPFFATRIRATSPRPDWSGMARSVW